jgi:hypothetical protein
MHFFLVLKGDVDICMVYGGSKSGLNVAIWDPWFVLPTVTEMLRTVLPGYWCADNDYGKMFLNFPLFEDLQKYCGMDLSQIFDKEMNANEEPSVGMWTRNAMGLYPSPYTLVQGLLRAKQMVLGAHKDKKNPYHWEWAQENLPGDDDNDPTLP